MVKLDRASAPGAVHLVGASLAGVLAGALVLGTSACTVLFNPDNIDRDGGVPPGAIDAEPGAIDAEPSPIDAEPRPDAMPGDLEIYTLSPDTVEEGVGLVRRVPVAINGANIAQNATVQLMGAGQDEQPRPLTVSENGTLAVFELDIPVDTTRDDSANTTITVMVTQGGQMEMLTLDVDWLDELVVTSAGNLDTGTLAARYSRIDIGANVQAIGADALRLVATAEIVLSASLSADGIDTFGSGGGMARAGGCAGGNEAQNGGCTPGGGLGAAIVTEAGGGGGGHADIGGMGEGTGGANGGSATGTAAMTDLGDEHGNGGGGGGGAGSGNGGGGGGGGGVIELTSLGTFRIDANGRLSVQGGNGGTCGGSSDNGGGGGGSGGAILLRSAQPISGGDSGTLLTLDGGLGGVGTCVGRGGDGAPGRARVDAIDVPNAAVSVDPFHGAVLDPATPTIVASATLTVLVRGAANQTYAVLGPEGPPQSVTLDSQGRGNKNVTLMPGVNRVCVLMTTTDILGGDDENCLDVAYVPPP